MSIDFIDVGLYIVIFFSGLLIGRYRNKADIDLINENLYLYNKFLMKKTDETLNSFLEKSELVHSENIKLIEKQNREAVNAMNTQAQMLGTIHYGLKSIKQSLDSHEELYQRIIMLQKIITKKKKQQ